MNTTPHKPEFDAVVDNCMAIATSSITWNDPAKRPPPFDTKLLLMVAGTRTDDCCRTWHPYTVVLTGKVSRKGPGDEYDEPTAIDEYLAGDPADFLEFQFDLVDEDDNELDDWYSDAIVAWAYYPLAAAQMAVDAAAKRGQGSEGAAK